MKTILISGLVSASSKNEHLLAQTIETMFTDIDVKLQQCYDLLPEHGHVIDNTCTEEDETLTCKFKCDETDNLHLLKNIVVSGYEIQCRCHQVIAGKRYKVPCAWSGLPASCEDPEHSVIPEYGSHCGELSDQNGKWDCSGSSCHLKCNHGYQPSDKEAQMSPRCTCNKFGDCSWFKPASCVQVNHENGKCEAEKAPLGDIECTGNGMGDMCELQCPAQFKAEQFGVRRCECNSAGACDWQGDRGRCEEDIQLPAAFAAFDEKSFGSLLSPAQRCKELPETEMGFWRCDSNQTCLLVCPPGFEANQQLEISCLCANGSCTFQNRNSLERRFQVSDIERTSGFECLQLIEDDMPDSVIMDQSMDRCADLPRIENGAWNCTHGTCNLRCVDDTDAIVERFVVDCLADDADAVDWSHVNCNRHPVRISPEALFFREPIPNQDNSPVTGKQKSGRRSHTNLANRNLAPLK